MGLANALSRFLALLFLQALGVACYDLDIKVGHEFNVATWECSTDVPLSSCQVALMDFSRSGQTVVLEVNEGLSVMLDDPESPVLMYEYNGLGLIDGVCGVRVTPRFEEDAMWVVGCRVKSEDSGWKYAWGGYYKASVLWMGEDLKAEPRQVVVLPGQEAVAVCKAHRALHTCWMGPPDLKSPFIFIEGRDYKQYNRHMYHGIGVSRGECGMEIEEVGEEDNGVVVCLAKASGLPEMYGWNIVPIIVAVPPVSVTLQVVHEDGIVSALCTVEGGRPATPNMTWLVGANVLSQDDLADNITVTWTWPWDVGIFSQKRSWVVAPEDDGVPVICVVKHPALQHSVVLWEELVFSEFPELIIKTKTVIIAEINSTSSTESTTSTTTESTTSTTTESTTSTTTELTPSTSTTSEPTTGTSPSTSTSTSKSTSTSTTEGPHTDCCCFVKRCHSLFRNNNLQRFCTKTFTCSKLKICCPQL